MKKGSTRDLIIDCALTLFSIQGYGAVTVQQIAENVGIKAPSLYKHFKSKQEIFSAIITELSGRYDKQIALFHIGGNDALQDRYQFADMSADTIVKLGDTLFSYYLHDSFAVRFRKMLTIGQFSSRELSEIYVKQYIDDSLSYQTVLFSFFIEKGLFVPDTAADIAALQFFAPIYILLEECTALPSREADARKMLERHIRQFVFMYMKK
jgi:AcrR family transcriptional regulator